MIERFFTGSRQRKALSIEADVTEMFRLQPVYVQLDLTTTAAQTIRHGLGRVPVGIRVVNMAVPAGTGDDVRWYREKGDDPWTDELLIVRWSVADARVLLEVF